MKKYKCQECGETFTLEESAAVSDCVGEFWGSPAYNEFVACPRCRCTDLDHIDDEDEE